MAGIFYIDGAYVSEEQAKISVLDLGLIRGFGVFDYLRTYRGRPFHLWDHLQRLNYSATQIGLHLPHSLHEIQNIIETLLQTNNYPESSIKIMITGGQSPDQLIPEGVGSLYILVYPFQPLTPEHHAQGIKTITTPLNRSIPTSKTLQYIPAIMALRKGRTEQAKEALYLNAAKEILEATTSNFFAFTKQGTLVTAASEEILFGITREVVLKLAKDHFPIEPRPLAYDEIKDLSEAFITSSNKEILPVTQIDHLNIAHSFPGKQTQFLMNLFTEYCQQGAWDPLNIARYQIS